MPRWYILQFGLEVFPLYSIDTWTVRDRVLIGFMEWFFTGLYAGSVIQGHQQVE